MHDELAYTKKELDRMREAASLMAKRLAHTDEFKHSTGFMVYEHYYRLGCQQLENYGQEEVSDD
jgi:hypothetical protein